MAALDKVCGLLPSTIRTEVSTLDVVVMPTTHEEWPTSSYIKVAVE